MKFLKNLFHIIEDIEFSFMPQLNFVLIDALLETLCLTVVFYDGLKIIYFNNDALNNFLNYMFCI